MIRDIFAADMYCYITTEFDMIIYTKRDSHLGAYGGVVLQRFEFLKVCMGGKGKRHYSRNFDILAVKMTYLSSLYIMIVFFIVISLFSSIRSLLSEFQLYISAFWVSPCGSPIKGEENQKVIG